MSERLPSMQVAAALLASYCQDLQKIEGAIYLGELRDKLEQELYRTKDAEVWCDIGEVPKLKKAAERISRLLLITEAIQRCLREYKKGI